MSAKSTPEGWEAIVLNRAFGMSNTKSAEKLGISATSVGAYLQAFDAIKDEDWAKCCNLIVSYNIGIEFFNWAAQKQGKTVPPILLSAYEKYKDDRRKKNIEAAKAKENDKQTPAAQGGDELKILVSQLLAEQRKTRELLETLIDVVIPKYVIDLKENINVNCDVINKTNLESQEKLEAIKLGFRKKGL